MATFIFYASSLTWVGLINGSDWVGLGWVRSGRVGKSGDFSQQLIKKVILNFAVLFALAEFPL